MAAAVEAYGTRGGGAAESDDTFSNSPDSPVPRCPERRSAMPSTSAPVNRAAMFMMIGASALGVVAVIQVRRSAKYTRCFRVWQAMALVKDLLTQ